jgi:hypothetical protein
MSEQHSEAVEQAFSQQASAFEDRRFNWVFTTDMEWVFERLTLDPDYLVLDVAAGTGHVARALAPFVRAELQGGAATGFHPREDDHGLHFVQRFASITVAKPRPGPTA